MSNLSRFIMIMFDLFCMRVKNSEIIRLIVRFLGSDEWFLLKRFLERSGANYQRWCEYYHYRFSIGRQTNCSSSSPLLLLRPSDVTLTLVGENTLRATESGAAGS